MKSLLNSIIFCLSFLSAFSQYTKVDSLRSVLDNATNDSVKCNASLDISNYYEAKNPDSALYYTNLCLEIAINSKLKEKQSSAYNHLGTILRRQGNYVEALDAYSKAIIVDEELGDLLGKSKNLNNIGLIYKDQGIYDKAIEMFSKSLEIKENLGDKKGIAGSLANLGIIYRYQGLYDKSIEHFITSIRILEELNDKDGIARCYTNIGNIHYNQANWERALEYFEKSLRIAYELNDIRGISRSLNNIAIIYRQQNNYPKAIEYYEDAIKITEKLGDKKTISIIYNNIGTIYRLQDNFDKALEYLLIAMNIRDAIGDKQGLASSYLSLSEFYNAMADSVKHGENSNHLNQAINYGMLAYNLSSEIGAIPIKTNAAYSLKESYTKLKRFDKALYYANIQLDINDSLYNQDKAKTLAEVETKYETEKKQQEIEKQQLLIERNAAHSQKQKNRIISLIIGSITLALLAVAIFAAYRQKYQKNIIITEKNALLEQYNEEIKATSEALTEQNETLKQQNEEIIKQRNEIEIQRNSLANLAWELQERKEEIEAQKNILSTQNNEITSSIIYAQRIQNAVLPSASYLNQLFGEHFIFYKPKSIVSGDFYWATRIRELLVFCVTDCTGHGVPGAFMSMMGVSFLNEIVRKEEVTNAAEVLNQLRDHVVNSMEETSESYNSFDGMDIGLCVLNTKTLMLQFSGANIPCWIASHNRSSNQNSLIELKPDSMPIARYERMEPFALFEYHLKENDKIYLASDGFADQFGGAEGKKFQKSRLMKLLAQNAEHELNEQKNLLETTFNEWKNSNNQVDDVTVLGIKV